MIQRGQNVQADQEQQGIRRKQMQTQKRQAETALWKTAARKTLSRIRPGELTAGIICRRSKARGRRAELRPCASTEERRLKSAGLQGKGQTDNGDHQ